MKQNHFLILLLSGLGGFFISMAEFLSHHTDWSFIVHPYGLAHLCWIFGTLVMTVVGALGLQPVKFGQVSENKLAQIKENVNV